MGGRLCSQPTTISLHKAGPGTACVRSTQITGSPLQSTDNNFSTQGGPWQCVRAIHTNNRVASTVDQQRFLYTRLPGNACVRAFHTNNRVTSAVDRQRYLYTRRALALRACVRSTQITGSPLQSTDNDISTQGGPWHCVRAFHTNNRVASAVTSAVQTTTTPTNSAFRPYAEPFRYISSRRFLSMHACVPHK